MLCDVLSFDQTTSRGRLIIRALTLQGTSIMLTSTVALIVLLLVLLQPPLQQRRPGAAAVVRQTSTFRLLQLTFSFVILVQRRSHRVGAETKVPLAWHGNLFPVVSPLAGTLLPSSSRCAQDSLMFAEATDNRTLWAVRMVDASTLSVSGALHGARIQMGSFDGCLSAGMASPLGSRYCLAKLSYRHQPSPADQQLPPWDHVPVVDPNLDAVEVLKGSGLVSGSIPPGEVLLALCVPGSCSAPKLQDALQRSVDAQPGTRGAFQVHVHPDLCVCSAEVAKQGALDWSGFTFWTVIVGLTGASIVGSLYGWKVWNWRTHLSVLGQPEPALCGLDLSALSGMRFVTAVMLVGAHRALHTAKLPHANVDVLTAESRQTALHSVGHHAALFVDTMLFASGLLAALGVLGGKNRKGALTTLVNRYLRLTPTYALVLWFYVAVMPSLGSGPLWKWIVHAESVNCQRRWWTNLLYVNNYVHGDPGERGCMLQSWTLAADMQLFMAASLLLPLLPARTPLRRTLLAATLVVSVLPPFLSTLAHHWPPVMIWTARVQQDVFADPMFLFAYIPTHMRATPYVTGVVVADQLLNMKASQMALSRRSTLLLTWVGTLALVLTLVSSVVFGNLALPCSPLLAAVYASLTPAVWSVSLGAVVLALVLGKHTLVRGFLSWQPMVSLSRLTYGVYLVHFFIQLLQGGSQRTSMYISAGTVTMNSFADVVVAFILSTFLYIIVEAPIRTLAKNELWCVCALFSNKEQDTTTFSFQFLKVLGNSFCVLLARIFKTIIAAILFVLKFDFYCCKPSKLLSENGSDSMHLD